MTQALVSGTGVAGVAICLLRITTKAVLPGTPAVRGRRMHARGGPACSFIRSGVKKRLAGMLELWGETSLTCVACTAAAVRHLPHAALGPEHEAAALPARAQGLRASASIYFALAALVCAWCVVLYAAVLPRLSVIRYYRSAALAAALAEAAEWGAGGGKLAGAEAAGSGGGARWWRRGAFGAAERVRLKPEGDRGEEEEGMSPGSSRPASAELTEMVEAGPGAAHAAHAAPAQRRRQQRPSSIDLELVAEDHQHHLSTSGAEAGGLGCGGGVRVATGAWQGLGGGLPRVSMWRAPAGGSSPGEWHPAASGATNLASPLWALAGCRGGPGEDPGADMRQQLLGDGAFPPYSSTPSPEPRQPGHPAGYGGGEPLQRGEAGAGLGGRTAGPASQLGVLRQLWRFAATNVVIYT